MSLALACSAIALLTLPVSRARRRSAALFRTTTGTRKFVQSRVIRGGAALVVLGALGLGMGPAVAATLVAGTLSMRLRRSDAQRRREVECDRLLEALEATVAELRVGAHPSTAAELASAEVAGEAAWALSTCAARGRLGGSAADGLLSPNSIVAPELSRIAGAWRVADQHGLALAELLAAARTDLLSRIRFRARTTAALAGARASATVLAGLPLLGLTLGQLMGAAPLHVLFASPTGTILLPLGSALACCGLLWTDVITRKVLI
ncbi:hypothetical protein D5S18_06440 [Nocardia panacis]|uniref:Type II secretion system protein GspF domain-containing protein n=1 Tax=Nocardia panacis TaxID=2340916 RepID=A0A3A4KCD6_9NOCA|nr:type II secretion system F family protein [Nocardia panacis]RJO77918.1 hypothetical protein D5S18_06440 [Nocardia panacis]